MKNCLLVLAALTSSLSAFSQKEIVATVSALIAGGNFPQAKLQVDTALALNPNDVDALMMKGNVFLNYALSKTAPLYIATTDDESIYSPDLAGLKNPPRMVSQAVAKQVELIWLKCLQLDSSRTDIRTGLCTLYGMALLREPLVLQLQQVVAASKEKGNPFAYTLATYAHLLKERGDSEGSYLVLENLCALYPEFAGIRSDVAAQYYSDGNLTEAKKHIALALAMPGGLDDQGIATAVNIYVASGEPQKALKAYSAAVPGGFKDLMFYQALYGFSIEKPGWKKDMAAFVLGDHSQDSVVVKISLFMASPSFKNSFADFLTMLNFEPNDFQLQLLSARAMKQFPDSIQPFFIYAETFLNGRNYARAGELFSALVKKKMAPQLLAEAQWQYAWALYAGGNFKAALPKWIALQTSENAGVKSSALYFTARCEQHLGNAAEAEKLYKQTTDQFDNKYGFWRVSW